MTLFEWVLVVIVVPFLWRQYRKRELADDWQNDDRGADFQQGFDR